ncbi:hypothetical protein BVX94_01010 [bacterium B17]|nr:hypothetical protein BVX94_01010 [bacterium B17]
MSFCTVINCMDGRVQVQVNDYLKEYFGAEYVDTITEPGPNGIIAKGENEALMESINTRIGISVEKHGSAGIAVVGHHDCAGNPVDQPVQDEQTRASVAYLRDKYPSVKVIGLWVNSDWQVELLEL